MKKGTTKHVRAIHPSSKVNYAVGSIYRSNTGYYALKGVFLWSTLNFCNFCDDPEARKRYNKNYNDKVTFFRTFEEAEKFINQ